VDRKRIEKMDGVVKAYFAGPDVFRENAVEYFDEIRILCENYYNIEPIFPIDSETEVKNSLNIYNINIEKIKQADIVVANLIPFRGPSCDVGTAFEIGYAKSLNKQIIGYYNGYYPGSYYERINYHINKYDMEYFPVIENFGNYDNLMIIHGCDTIKPHLYDALLLIKERGANG